MSKLQNDIMNLPCKADKGWVGGEQHAYKLGHRDARHAAAELVAAAEATSPWVSVLDRLPKCNRAPHSFGTEVSIHPPVKSGRTAFFGRRVTTRPGFYKHGVELLGITHWAPLPSSPPPAQPETGKSEAARRAVKPAAEAEAAPAGMQLVPSVATSAIACAIEDAIDEQLRASGIEPGRMHRQDGDRVWAAAIRTIMEKDAQ